MNDTITNGHVQPVPANGQPVNLAEAIDREALAYRSQETVIGDFLATQLERLAQIIRFTESVTPAEFSDRFDVLEGQARDQWREVGFEDGFQAGLRAARRQLA